ncbi:hypothetical protein [Streptomyces sp. LMG1-1-1.1]
MAAVFVITTSTIGRRLGVLPRPLVAVGYLNGLRGRHSVAPRPAASA